MKILLGLVLALAGASLFLFNSSTLKTQSQLQSSINPLYKEFQIWKQIHGKSYTGSIETQKFAAWLDNYFQIEDFNAQETGSLRLKINSFSDLTNEEFAALYTRKMTLPQTNQNQNYEYSEINEEIPASVNWKKKGLVGWPSSQGACNAGWAFSIKEALDAVYKMNSDLPADFSVQQLIDCANSNGYTTCSGEQTDNIYMYTYNYTHQNGIERESSYPYYSGIAGELRKCNYQAEKAVFKNSGAKVVPPENQIATQSAVVNQPLSVSIDASSYQFQHYYDGVIYNKCGTSPNHSVLIYGYETQDPEEPFSYYFIQNSWGYTWGNFGTAKIAMNGDGIGVCAIQSSLAYPIY